MLLHVCYSNVSNKTLFTDINERGSEEIPVVNHGLTVQLFSEVVKRFFPANMAWCLLRVKNSMDPVKFSTYGYTS
jgi:hypothetical protein